MTTTQAEPAFAARISEIDQRVRQGVTVPEEERLAPLSQDETRRLLECLLHESARLGRSLETLEVGFGWGMSASTFLASGCVRNHLVVSYDPVQERVRQARENVGKFTTSDARIDIVLQRSEYELPAMAAAGRVFDVILLDGGHRFEEILIDMHYSAKLLAPGGVLLVDDLWMPSVKTACSWFETNLSAVLEKDPASHWNLRAYRRTVAEDRRSWRHFVPFRVHTSEIHED